MRRLGRSEWAWRLTVAVVAGVVAVGAKCCDKDVPAANDCWETPAVGTEFALPEIEHNFFGPGSDLIPAGTIVKLKGNPLSESEFNTKCGGCQDAYDLVWVDLHGAVVADQDLGDHRGNHTVTQVKVFTGTVDTCVERKAFEFKVPGTNNVEVKLKALNLKSVQPLEVPFVGGTTDPPPHPTKAYDVYVTESNPQQWGKMKIKTTKAKTTTDNSCEADLKLGGLPIRYDLTFKSGAWEKTIPNLTVTLESPKDGSTWKTAAP